MWSTVVVRLVDSALVEAGSRARPRLSAGTGSTTSIVGGYYLLEAPDLDEAIRLASLIAEATAAHRGLEIRPIAAPA